MTNLLKVLAPLWLCVSLIGCGVDPQTSYDLSSNGSSAVSDRDDRVADWNRAFSWRTSRREKARLIASSVRGIGEPTAVKVLDAGYLFSKPYSWTAFKNEMRRASQDRRAGVPDVYSNTVEKYGSDNSELFKSGSITPPSSRGWGCTFDRYASDSRKAGCLADAVRGIGSSTASTLIRNDEFRYPPATWNKFKEYMQILERRYNLNDLYDNTVVKYGSDNRRKLY
jgi:hypothetical protein